MPAQQQAEQLHREQWKRKLQNQESVNTRNANDQIETPVVF